MGTMSTVQALVFITKAIIELALYLTGRIKRGQYIERLDKMSESIRMATTGELETRVEGGHQVEDQINSNAGKGGKG